MPKKRYLITEDNVHLERDNKVHAILPVEKNFTMCGIAWVNDEEEVLTRTKAKITCPHCIYLIDYCKSIKEKDIKRS